MIFLDIDFSEDSFLNHMKLLFHRRVAELFMESLTTGFATRYQEVWLSGREQSEFKASSR